jgi:hypothetical protein
MRFARRLLELPWATFSWMLWRTARWLEGAQQATEETKDRVLRGAVGGAGKQDRGPGEQIAGPNRKEDDMSDWNGDDQVRLFEYTLVTIRRDDERILAHGQRLVTDPMTEDEFKAWVIADYTRQCPDLPSEDYQYLRVATQFLARWHRQPLHYESRQLKALEDISAKLGPPVPYENRHRDAGPRGRSVDQVVEC